MRNNLTLFISILTFLACNSDKPELVKQFDDLSESEGNKKVVGDPFYVNGRHESWFLLGEGQLGGFMVHYADKYMPSKDPSGHYFLKMDFDGRNMEKMKMQDIEDDPHFRLAYKSFASIICLSNKYKEVTFRKSIDFGESWYEFAHENASDPTSEINIQLSDHLWDGFIFFDENSGRVAFNGFNGVKFYDISDGNRLSYAGELPGLYVDDFEFLNRNLGYVLGREVKNVLPSQEEHAYLFKTLDGGKTWSDTMIVDEYRAFDDLIVVNQSELLCRTGGRLFGSRNGGKTWGEESDEVNETMQIRNGDQIFQLEQVYRPGNYNNFIFTRSLDLGKSFGNYSVDTLRGILPHLSFDDIGQVLVYFESGHVYVSSDQGKNWETVKEGVGLR